MSFIENKIAKIRKQEPHIRLRWVYGCAIIAMLIVLVIWALSIKVSLREDYLESESGFDSITDKLGETFNGDTANSIKDVIEDGKEAVEEVKEITEGEEAGFGSTLDSILGDQPQAAELEPIDN